MHLPTCIVLFFTCVEFCCPYCLVPDATWHFCNAYGPACTMVNYHSSRFLKVLELFLKHASALLCPFPRFLRLLHEFALEHPSIVRKIHHPRGFRSPKGDKRGLNKNKQNTTALARMSSSSATKMKAEHHAAVSQLSVETQHRQSPPITRIYRPLDTTGLTNTLSTKRN